MTTLELVLQKLQAEGLRSPLHPTWMGTGIRFLRLQVLCCVESHVSGTHGDIPVACHVPSVSGVQSSADMLELSAGGPSLASVDTDFLADFPWKSRGVACGFYWAEQRGPTTSCRPWGFPLLLLTVGKWTQMDGPHVPTPPGLCSRPALEIRL